MVRVGKFRSITASRLDLLHYSNADNWEELRGYSIASKTGRDLLVTTLEGMVTPARRRGSATSPQLSELSELAP